jgi:hypothetical protein
LPADGGCGGKSEKGEMALLAHGRAGKQLTRSSYLTS